MVSLKTKRRVLAILVIGPPVFTVLILAFLSLKSATQDILETNSIRKHLKAAQVLQDLVASLQQERGMTCVYLSREKGDPERESLAAKLSIFRQRTDAFVTETCECTWPATTYETKLAFDREIRKFRMSVGQRVTKCEAVLNWYTNATNALLNSINRAFLESDEGTFWSNIQAVNLMLSAKDIIGVKRAMGGTFYASGGFSHQSELTFQRLTGSAESFLKNVWSAVPPAAELYKRLTWEKMDLMAEIAETEKEISYNNLSQANTIKGLGWFQNVTSYMTVLTKVEAVISNEVIEKLETKSYISWTNFFIVAFVVCLSAIMCPLVVFKFGVQVSQGRKTENLLHQMMPVTVAKKFLEVGAVRPEEYMCITVFHSDIYGFPKLAADSTPFQIVELLNNLYTKCDEIIEKFDCYKVETSGGSMTVVSGLPQLNGDFHSDSICNMSLAIMEMMEHFKIPSNSEHLLIRAGISTGPCAAGIVGIKMPRYNIFGDSVNTASYLQETAKASCIQISSRTQNHLNQNHPARFVTERRGTVELPTKGVVETFWLLGQEKGKFQIDLAMAAAKMKNTKYWKTANGSRSGLSLDDVV